MRRTIADWRVGELAVSLAAEGRPAQYILRWCNEGSELPAHEQAEGEEGDERFERCSAALRRAKELGAQVDVWPGLERGIERCGIPRTIDEDGRPWWKWPYDVGPLRWSYFLDREGLVREDHDQEYIYVAWAVLERCEPRAMSAFRRGLVPDQGIGGRVMYVQPPDPVLDDWYPHLGLPRPRDLSPGEWSAMADEIEDRMSGADGWYDNAHEEMERRLCGNEDDFAPDLDAYDEPEHEDDYRSILDLPA